MAGCYVQYVPELAKPGFFIVINLPWKTVASLGLLTERMGHRSIESAWYHAYIIQVTLHARKGNLSSPLNLSIL